MQQIHYDDIAALEAHISAELGPWGPTIQVSQEMIQGFADITGDHQWIHVDPERARDQSPFGGTIAHGFLTLSLLPRLQAPAGFEVVGHSSVINYGADKLRFLAPVPAGSEIHARRRLVQVQARPKGTLLTSEIVVQVVGDQRPAVVYRGLGLFLGMSPDEK